MNREEELKVIIKELKRIRKNIKNKIWNLNNKEWRKNYYQNNIEKEKESMKKYYQTPNGKKAYRISSWKYIGLIAEDYDIIYEKYINTTNCDLCDCILTYDKENTPTTKSMDHCHHTGLFRNILCHSCNRKRN